MSFKNIIKVMFQDGQNVRLQSIEDSRISKEIESYAQNFFQQWKAAEDVKKLLDLNDPYMFLKIPTITDFYVGFVYSIYHEPSAKYLREEPRKVYENRILELQKKYKFVDLNY